MSITTDRNDSYGPPLVTQKYRPLENPTFALTDEPLFSGMLTNRDRLLRATGMLGQQLKLATTPSWAAITAAEAGHLPPLVVISSNRAGWIKDGIASGAAQLAKLRIAAFTNASDLRALTDETNQGISPPLYAPSRIGANRNVYVVVHMAEYTYYKTQLAGTGLTPVGWEFTKGTGARRNLNLVGFGASRFAAMEFCKLLRRRAATAAGGAAPWNAAWLIDDNTVALGNFAGFASVEAALGANVCAGFHGGTKAITQDKNKTWAEKEIREGRGGQAAGLPPSAPPGIIQQTALWNVQYFDTNFLNFGPIYIASAEDLSITNYFNAARIPYLYYNGINVVKEEPAYDNKTAAQKVNRSRQELTAWVAAAESANPPVGTPPPPIRVQAFRNTDGGEQLLSTFVVNRVLPNAKAVNGTDLKVQDQAKCQAVEQLTCAALNVRRQVSDPAIATTFKTNGATQQVVQALDVP